MTGMTLLLVSVGAAFSASGAPALAQTDPHAHHQTKEHPAPSQTDPHADHATEPHAPAKADPHAHHPSEPPAAPAPLDPHADHAMEAEDHSAPAGTNLPPGNAPPPLVVRPDAADAIYGADAMAMGRHHLLHHHGAQTFSKVMVDTAEVKVHEGHQVFAWGGEAWIGGDIDRFVLKSEGELEFSGPVESAEVQALYSRAIGPYFDFQTGFRYDFAPNPSRAYAVLGFEGLAPGFFEVEGALFLSDKGELLARIEGSYDQRITQRLILQPDAEANFAAQGNRALGIGKGLSDAEFGLRLRYDIAREFAPYVGVEYEQTFGQTRRYRREAGADTGGFVWVAGVRFWF